MTLCQRRPDPAAPASMLVLARTTVHAISHDGGIFVSIPHLLPYLQAVLTRITHAHRWAVGQMVSSVREAGPWRSDISERRCADVGATLWDPACKSRVWLIDQCKCTIEHQNLYSTTTSAEEY